MYNKFANQVKDFDKTFDCHLPKTESIIQQLLELGVPEEKITTDSIRTLMNLYKRAMFGTRLGLMVEEMGEWAEAVLKEKTQGEQDKEVADLLYVTIGTADVLADENFESPDGGLNHVLGKNQVKLDNPEKMKRGKNGKVIKPEDF